MGTVRDFGAGGSCPTSASFDDYPTCSNIDQCQQDYCFYAGFCTTSSNNNCNNDSPLFPPSSGDKMDNHDANSFGTDGCFCDYSITTYDGEPRQACDQTTLQSESCWG